MKKILNQNEEIEISKISLDGEYREEHEEVIKEWFKEFIQREDIKYLLNSDFQKLEDRTEHLHYTEEDKLFIEFNLKNTKFDEYGLYICKMSHSWNNDNNGIYKEFKENILIPNHFYKDFETEILFQLYIKFF